MYDWIGPTLLIVVGVWALWFLRKEVRAPYDPVKDHPWYDPPPPPKEEEGEDEEKAA